MPRDHYEVLGLSKTAGADEIRRAHRKLAKEFHPDRNKAPEAATRFAEIQGAYEVLSDDKRRAQYDQFGHSGPSQSPYGPGGQQGQSAAWQNVNQDDLEEMLGGLGGIGDFFRGGSSARGRTRRPTPQQGENSSIEVTVDFMTAAIGGTRNIALRDASGKSSSIDVKIPAGIPNGGSLRIPGKGHPGQAGGPAGDLLLVIRAAPHPWFIRDGLDISVEVPITIVEAALGATIDVPLLKGSVQLKIPAGTSSGKKLRIPGKGIAPAQGPAGDFFAMVQIVAPTSLDAVDQKSLKAIGDRLPSPRDNRWG